MFGGRYARMVSGRWHHIGYLMTSGLPVELSVRTVDQGNFKVTSTEKVIPPFTLVMAEAANEFSMVLSSGIALGILTQPVSLAGLSNDAGFVKATIGKFDNPVKRGYEVSIRQPAYKTMLEAEGLGDALPGNLVCTTGGDAIDGSTTYMKALTAINGCLQEAGSGDVIVGYFHRLLTPIVDAGNTRILWEWAGGNNVL